MIFSRTWQLVLSGRKTQTRRPIGDTDYSLLDMSDELEKPVISVYRNGRLLWEVGRVYAVQPGRGEKAVGRIQLTEIRPESLQDISREDAFVEGTGDPSYDDEISGICLGGIAGGCGACPNCEPEWYFFQLWDEIHKKAGTKSEDNPEVWVLSFKLVGG